MRTITSIIYPLFAFACLALPPLARATCQEGCLTFNNTALGDDALLNNYTGGSNTAIGFNALYSNTIGHLNTATGFDALYSNINGYSNTANVSPRCIAIPSVTATRRSGLKRSLTTHSAPANTAIGGVALNYNTTGFNNTATGDSALYLNETGSYNTANGADALYFNSGSNNTATGADTLYSNTIGTRNTATGAGALYRNTTGIDNTAHGANALYRNTTGNNNIAVGVSAGFDLTTGNNNIYIGNTGNNREYNKIRIGTTGVQKATFIAGISGVTVPAGVGVIVGTDGKLGTVVSSERFKDAIKPMDNEAILALKPVTFQYKKDLDPVGIPQFGLVAEQVEKVNPDLVACDKDGKPYSVRYEAVNGMLLNEFLKEHRTVQELKSTATKQEAIIAHQQTQIEALTVGLQKVSDQLELSKTAPRTVDNP